MQTQKIHLVCKGSFEVAGPVEADAKDKDQILVRIVLDNKFYIRVMDRLSGEVSTEFPSKCNHSSITSLIAHPTDAGFVLESCWTCAVIRNYNIHTGHCSIVYKGDTSDRICHGPIGSILVCSHPIFRRDWGLSIMQWDKEHQILQTDKSVNLKCILWRMCYSELFDTLVFIYHSRKVEAVKLESEADTSKLSAPIWKISGVVDGLAMNPTALTSDNRGNVFVGDGANNRILKVNSLTGDIVGLLLLEENNQEIRYLFWSGSILTVVRGDRFSTYNIPKLD